MINGRMSQREILNEFWKEYHEIIKPRCFRIVERERKELAALQKKRPDQWLKMKKLVEVKSEKGNHYNIILWSKIFKHGQTAIKTCTWFSYLGDDGKRRIVLLPSEERTPALILFSAGFFNDWREQLGLGETGVELEKQFFLWVEGNYKVYHNEEDKSQVEVDLNNLGAGIGEFKEPGTYHFKHFLGDVLIGKMQEKVGRDIMDPLELWNAYHQTEIKVPEEPTYDYQSDLNSIFDEITEKYG
jgi:hypothetical protein